FGRRRLRATAAFALASSFDFLQGTFEKIHLQCLVCQQSFQLAVLSPQPPLSATDPCRPLPRLQSLQPSPLVQQSPVNPEFPRQFCRVLAVIEPIHRHLPKLLRISMHPLSCHFAAPFSAKCSSCNCLSFGVHSTRSTSTPLVHDPLVDVRS